MTQRQIHKRQNLYHPESDSVWSEAGPHFPRNKFMALPLSDKGPGSPSPPSPQVTGYHTRPGPYLPQHGEPQIMPVAGKLMTTPLVINNVHPVRTKPLGVIPAGFHSLPGHNTPVRRKKQIIGDSVFFVKPGEELIRGKPVRSTCGSRASVLSHMSPGNPADDNFSISSGLSGITLSKDTQKKKQGRKLVEGLANQFWVSVDDSVFEESGHSSGERDSPVRQPPAMQEGRAMSAGGLTHYSQGPLQIKLASSSRTAVRPSTVSASSFTSRRTQSILDHDYYYRQPSTSPQYYTVGRNSERFMAVNREHREAMDYSANSLPRGITVYRPSSEVALHPHVNYYQPIQYDTYSKASSTTLVRSKVLSTSMPHLHKAGLELSKADKKVLKKLQKEEKKRQKEEKKHQKDLLKRKKKKGQPIYDMPIRVHNTVPRNFHQTSDGIHRSPGLVYVPIGRDPASRPPLAPPPSQSDVRKVQYQAPLSPKLANKVFHTSAPDLLRVEQVYGRAELSPRQHPSPTLENLPLQRDGPRTVLLQKGREGFGFVLRGAKSKHMPVSSLDFHPTAEYPALQYLDSVDPGSMAEKAGLNSGDFILEINGQNVVQASHERVVELIKASGDTLKLKVITVRPQEKNWFVHQDGCMTLPTRGKGKAPQPPKRNPNTSLSYSKGRSKSFAEGLAEIEKLDETLAQYDGAGSRSMTGLDKVGSTEGDTKIASIRTRHAAKRASCIQLDGEYVGTSERKTTPPVLPKKYASPSELRIQRYHRKYQQGTLEKARSTPNLAQGEDGKEVIYATPHVQAGNGPLTQNGSNRHFSSNGYKTVLSIGSGDSDSSTSSDSVSGKARGKARQNIYSVPHTAPQVTSLRAATHSQTASNISQGVATGKNVRSHGPTVNRPQKPVSGVVIPPPPRKPAPQPPVKSEMVCISTNSSIYANVSAEIQARKAANTDSPYESSFRPGTNAKVTKDPDVTTASVEQAKLRHQRKGSIGSLQHAQQSMSAEDKQKFLSFPRHGHPPAELQKPSGNEGPRTVSFADDRVFENAASFMEHHPNANLLVTANMNSSERRRLSKDLYEPEPDYDADIDDGDAVVPKPTAVENTSRRSSSSSASSVSNRSDVPVSIHTQTRPLGSSGVDANTSVTVISVGNESPNLQPPSQTKSDSIPHYSVNSNIPKLASDSKESTSSRQVKDNADTSDSPSLLANQIRLAAMARDKRREEQANQATSVTVPPPAPAIPPAPSPPTPAVPSQEAVSRSSPSTMSSRPSAEEIQMAVAERQTRLQNGGAERLLDRPVAGDSTRKKPLDQTQAAILAAVAKRRSVLEQSPEKDIVNQIESKLNKTKKLQSVKYYGSGSQPQTQAEKKPITATPKTAEKPIGKASPKPATAKETPVTKNCPVEPSKDSQNNGSNFLALAEKARQEYLQKKNNDSGKKDGAPHPSIKTPPPPPVKSVSSKGQSSAKTNSNLKASSEVSSRPDHSYIKNSSDTNSEENKSIQDKIKSFEKKLDFSSIIRNNNNSGFKVGGVTEDDSHTEADSRIAGQLPSGTVAPPAAFSDHSNVVSEDVVEIEIIPPPSTFAGEDHGGSPDRRGDSAFGQDDTVSLHSSVSTLSTLSSEHGDVAAKGQPISALEEVIAPPPPGFGDNQEPYIPPPPEFQETNSPSKTQSKPFSSKAVDQWNCVDVLDWLESLNMLQYRSSFASHLIDGKRLVELNRNDYIELGVTQVGHRMNMERSIKKLALKKPAVY